MVVVRLDIVFDRLNQLGHAVKNATSDLLVGQLGEPALDQVEPGGASGNEVQMKARSFG